MARVRLRGVGGDPGSEAALEERGTAPEEPRYAAGV